MRSLIAITVKIIGSHYSPSSCNLRFEKHCTIQIKFHKSKGTLPNIARNCIINVGEIVVYDITKEALIGNGLFKDGVPCHFSAAVVAGFCATVVASPVDVIKTR